MGMFDDYEIEIECPYCGRYLESMQGKDGPCTLRRFMPGDRMRNNDNELFSEGLLELHEICSREKGSDPHWVEGVAVVHEGVWIATIITTVSTVGGGSSGNLWDIKNQPGKKE